jgi:hypothetical protein
MILPYTLPIAFSIWLMKGTSRVDLAWALMVPIGFSIHFIQTGHPDSWLPLAQVAFALSVPILYTLALAPDWGLLTRAPPHLMEVK